MPLGTAVSISPSTNPIVTAPPGISRARARRRCAGRCTRPPRSRDGHAHLIAPTTSRPPSASVATAPVSRSRASSSSAATTRCANSAMTPSRHRPSRRTPVQVAQPRAARQAAALPAPSLRQLTTAQMLWPLDPGFGCAVWQRVPAMPEPTNNDNDLPPTPSRASSPHSHRCAAAGSRSPAADTPPRVDGLERLSGRNAFPPAGSPHQTSRRRPTTIPGPRTEVSLGARAQNCPATNKPTDHPVEPWRP